MRQGSSAMEVEATGLPAAAIRRLGGPVAPAPGTAGGACPGPRAAILAARSPRFRPFSAACPDLDCGTRSRRAARACRLRSNARPAVGSPSARSWAAPGPCPFAHRRPLSEPLSAASAAGAY